MSLKGCVLCMDSLHQLTHLRTDTNRSRWTEATAFRAPHKPFLLLSIYHLRSEGFWRLVPKPGQESELGEKITSSMTRLQSVVMGAKISTRSF